MSRHRNLRHMIQEDEYDDYDDDDYYDDGGDDDYYVKTKPPPPPSKQQQPAKQQPNTKKTGVAAAAVSNKNLPKQQSSKQQQQSQQNPKGMSPLPKPAVTTAAGAVPTTAAVTVSKTITTTNAQPTIPSILLQKILTPTADNNDTYYKPTLSVVILGHVDAGKSTLTGRLLYSSSSMPSMTSTISNNNNTNTTINKKGKIISNINNNASNNNNNTINYAWLLDEDEKERQHNITMDVGIKLYETPSNIPYNILLHDSPGHIDYIPCMLTGTYYADSICFVIDVTNAIKSLYNGGQLREHIYLARGLSNLPTNNTNNTKKTLSTDQQVTIRNKSVIIICNKMDLIQWDYKQFNTIKQMLTSFLTSQQIGYHIEQIQFIPVSGYNGINVINKYSDNENNNSNNNKKSKKMMNQNNQTEVVVSSNNNDNKNMEWINEYPTLQNVLYNHLIIPNNIRKKLLMKPLRILITEVDIESSTTNNNSKNSIIVRIKIIQGYMTINQPLIVLPIQDIIMIPKIITRNLQLLNSNNKDERNTYGAPGDLLECYMKSSSISSSSTSNNNDVIDVQRISVGSILCHPNDNTKPILSNIIRARIILLDLYTTSSSESSSNTNANATGVVPIIRGTSCIFHIQYIDIPCYFSKLLYTFTLSNSTKSTTATDTSTTSSTTTQSSSSNNKKNVKNLSSSQPPPLQQQSKQKTDTSDNKDNNNNSPFIIERMNPRALTFPNHHHHIQASSTKTYNNNNNISDDNDDKSSFYHDNDNETSSWAMVEITLSTPICMEPYHICRTLGQFVLRRNGISIAIGRIEQVLPSTSTITSTSSTTT